MSTLTDYTPIDRLIDYLEEYIKDEVGRGEDMDQWDYCHLLGLKDALATAVSFRDRYGSSTD